MTSPTVTAVSEFYCTYPHCECSSGASERCAKAPYPDEAKIKRFALEDGRPLVKGLCDELLRARSALADVGGTLNREQRIAVSAGAAALVQAADAHEKAYGDDVISDDCRMGAAILNDMLVGVGQKLLPSGATLADVMEKCSECDDGYYYDPVPRRSGGLGKVRCKACNGTGKQPRPAAEAKCECGHNWPNHSGHHQECPAYYIESPAAHTAQDAGWFLPADKLNHLQHASVDRQIERCSHAHHTDLRIRINGQYEYMEADWIKHMSRLASTAERS